MTYGMTTLNNQKSALFDSINQLYVEELTVKIKAELLAIGRQDSESKQVIMTTHITSRLDDLLHTINRSDIIPHANELIMRINRILDKIGDDEIASMFKSVSALLKQAEELTLRSRA